ncbi:MAG: transcriptional regulator [Actinomyces sp.]|uniref:transcriptional regulator n=1 Tax=Actinomyces sp. TaxID=29317 RepID=UPI0026DB46F1|nr:transcriptional regulator [Actinomyces sp.]MDO4243922.1 transcriptional regulator [Actinomyces sp.]
MSTGPTVLDPVIHAQARLRIMTALASLAQGDEIVFPRLREVLGMTAGNLSTHLSRLEDAGYVSLNKAFAGRTPATYVALTSQGRRAFEDYTQTLRSMLGGLRDDTP